jgi:adenylate cyclase
MPIQLSEIRPCFEGAVPAAMATADTQGDPNVTLISQVDYVDERHVALSFQFFNKTRRNILENPDVQLLVVHPFTGAHYRIGASYLRTELEGPLFERMKAKLAGIASYTGMGGVFKLLGSDVYEVHDIEQVPTPVITDAQAAGNRLPALRRACDRLAGAADLAQVLDRLLEALGRDFGIAHAMLLLADASGQRLYTVGSLGYARSGVGSEVAVGEGVIGVAAQSGTAIRINHLTQDAAYCRWAAQPLASAAGVAAEREIAYPGLAEPHSQLALPIQAEGRLLGVLFVESPYPMAFDADLEDALAVICTQAGALLKAVKQGDVDEEGAAAPPSDDRAWVPAVPASSRAPLRVRYFEADSSVFLENDYLIKGVAGAILWALLRESQASGRCEFTNRELRLSPALRLPDVNDNLEARLVLLQRRLAERGGPVRIEKTGRGRFRLGRPPALDLSHVPR